jgi:hypothetical protein
MGSPPACFRDGERRRGRGRALVPEDGRSNDNDRVQPGESVLERGARDVPEGHRARVAGMPVRGLSSRDRSRTAGAAARE